MKTTASPALTMPITIHTGTLSHPSQLAKLPSIRVEAAATTFAAKKNALTRQKATTLCMGGEYNRSLYYDQHVD